jgi:hypothetical protein
MTKLTRERVHTRTITLDGYARSDGLMDIEGEIKDVKTYDFPNVERGMIAANEALHHMKVKITIDDELNIIDATAETLAAPYPAICPSATIAFKNLVGLTIGSGWRRNVRQAIGGITGCTHITELMGPVATVAIQTLYGEKSRRKRQGGASVAKSHDVDNLADTCIGHARDYQAALDTALNRAKHGPAAD